MKLELKPEIEAGLLAQARGVSAEGLDLKFECDPDPGRPIKL